MPRRDFIDIEHGCVPSALNTAMLFDGLENVPSMVAVPLISGQSIGYEERFDRFRAGKKGACSDLRVIFKYNAESRTEACNAHHRAD